MTCPHRDEEDALTTVQAQPMTLLPPAPHLCRFCAADHRPHEPHDATSLYYQTRFPMAHGRHPTWVDALSHCALEVQHDWREQLEELHVWSEPPEGVAVVAEQA